MIFSEWVAIDENGAIHSDAKQLPGHPVLGVKLLHGFDGLKAERYSDVKHLHQFLEPMKKKYFMTPWGNNVWSHEEYQASQQVRVACIVVFSQRVCLGVVAHCISAITQEELSSPPIA